MAYLERWGSATVDSNPESFVSVYGMWVRTWSIPEHALPSEEPSEESLSSIGVHLEEMRTIVLTEIRLDDPLTVTVGTLLTANDPMGGSPTEMNHYL